MQLNTSENMEQVLKASVPSSSIMNSSGRKLLIISVILSLSLGFGGGFLFSNYNAGRTLPVIQKLVNQDSGKPEEVDFALFWEVWNALNKKYVNPSKLDMQKMIYGAISGMVDSVGDPYTVFFEPKISQKFQEEISGAFGGVGIEVGKRDGVVTVISPLKGTPAFKAGILAGDKVIKVDTKVTADLTIDEVVNLIRGKVGTKVVLTISRNGGSKDYELIREVIKVPSVKWELLNGDVAYLQIYTFSKNVDSDFEEAAQEILKSNATKLIIDLRNNPGGLLDSAINLAGWMLDRGQIVTMEEFRDGTRQEFKSDGNGALKKYPTILLVNGGSASASEILSGALHDNRNIQLVGEKSFGKGSVQELEDFENGSSLKVTIARWLTPNGRSITDLGIEPDVKVELKEVDMASSSFEFGKAGKDPQLDKALDILK